MIQKLLFSGLDCIPGQQDLFDADGPPEEAEVHEGGVTCNICGEWWPKHPARLVVCPDCKASVGSPCRRASGHECNIHVPREALAVEMGLMSKCKGRRR